MEQNTTHRVFVYGTLKKGHGNHLVMYPYNHDVEPVFIGEGITEDPFLVTTCGFPYVIDPRDVPFDVEVLPVRGEVFEVDDVILENLNSLEGFYEEDHEHNHYNRKTKKIIMENGTTIEAMVYVANIEENVSSAYNLPKVGTEEFMDKKVYKY